MVLASEQDAFPMDKITTSKEFKSNPTLERINFKTTTYEDFLSDKKVDTFDFVLLIFIQGASADDLLVKQEYYDYYTQVPIVHYAIHQKEQDHDELQGVKTFLRETANKRLIKSDPLVFRDVSDTAACVEALAADI